MKIKKQRKNFGINIQNKEIFNFFKKKYFLQLKSIKY